MATIKEFLAAIAPSIPDNSTTDLFIEMAENEVNENIFGTLYNQAVAYLVAHNFTISQGSSTSSISGGGIKRKKAGQEELEYHSPSSSSGSGGLGLTSYGQKFLELKMQVTMFRHSNQDALTDLED
jgi:hypothetical protein